MNPIIIKDGGTIERNCMMCKHFASFQEEYEDDMEPYEYGHCNLIYFAFNRDASFTGADNVCATNFENKD